MLGSMARKLRAFGFDTSYFSGGDDELMEVARSEERVVVTADRALAARCGRRGIPVLLVRGATDGARLSSMRGAATQARIPLAPGDARCSVCNGGLRPLGRGEAGGMVPESVLARHRLFFRCADCGRVYWRGSHWKKLRYLQGRLAKTPR
jgi:uncharacterized protein